MDQLFFMVDRLKIVLAIPNTLISIHWPDALLILLLILALLALIRGLYEPGVLEVTESRLVLGSDGQTDVDKNLADGSDDVLRIALFSDLHADSLRIRPQELSSALRKAPVDLLVFLGDLASDDQRARRAIPFMQVISDEAKAAGIPFLAVLGNHDGPQARQILVNLGVEILEDTQWTWRTANGIEVLITGFPDLKSAKPDISLLSHPETPDGMRIVLAHNPDTILHLPEDSGDFFLGGHFHGGQIYAPYQLEFRILRSDKLPRMGIWRGAFQMKGFTGYITRGLGCIWLPIRFFSKPEFSLLELVKKRPAS